MRLRMVCAGRSFLPNFVQLHLFVYVFQPGHEKNSNLLIMSYGAKRLKNIFINANITKKKPAKLVFVLLPVLTHTYDLSSSGI